MIISRELNPSQSGVQTFFDQSAEHYQKSRGEDADFLLLRKIVANMIPAEKSQVLDVGCGVGTVSVDLAQQGHDVLGIDLSPEMIKWAKQYQSQLDPQLQKKLLFRSGGLIELNLPSNSFQHAIALGVLEYVKNKQQFLKEIYRILSPEGLVILQIPNKASIGEALMQLAFKMNQKLGRAQAMKIDRQLLRSKELKKLLAEQGFKTLEISYCYYYIYPFSRLFPKLSKKWNQALSNKSNSWYSDFLGGAYVIKAQKLAHTKSA